MGKGKVSKQARFAARQTARGGGACRMSRKGDNEGCHLSQMPQIIQQKFKFYKTLDYEDQVIMNKENWEDVEWIYLLKGIHHDHYKTMVEEHGMAPVSCIHESGTRAEPAWRPGMRRPKGHGKGGNQWDAN